MGRRFGMGIRQLGTVMTTDMEMAVERQQLMERLKKAIGDLPPREQQIIRWRYLDDDKLTLHECGARLGITGARVRQIEFNVIRKLKKYRQELRNAGGFDFLQTDYAPDYYERPWDWWNKWGWPRRWREKYYCYGTHPSRDCHGIMVRIPWPIYRDYLSRYAKSNKRRVASLIVDCLHDLSSEAADLL